MQKPQFAHIAVIDFGSQYTHLMVRRLRDLGAPAYMYAPHTLTRADTEHWKGIVLSGGPNSLTDANAPRLETWVLDLPLPLLGLCYGFQYMAQHLGGMVERQTAREYGMAPLEIRLHEGVFAGLPKQTHVWMSHGDSVTKLPADAQCLASSHHDIAAFSMGRIWALQFHPEVSHTELGNAMLKNFIGACALTETWNPASKLETTCERIRTETNGRSVAVFVSGGVDSLVTLVLCACALGRERVQGIHIDTGLMRKNESQWVMGYLRDQGFENIHCIEAHSDFYKGLNQLVDPEDKRKAIGKLFVDLYKQHMNTTLQNNADIMLAQGTIYPDTIESGATAHSQKIKTHHNRVEEIDRLNAEGRIIEPISEFYKDEVRALGRELGIPEALLNRHPFPGPGLGIRILCAQENEPAFLNTTAAQHDSFFMNVLNVRSVGVQGDGRTYKHPAVLWFRTGDLNCERAVSHARRLINTDALINRVVLAFEDLGTLGLTKKPTFVTAANVRLLQEVDALCTQFIPHTNEVWQMPVVMLPLYDAQNRPCFVVRPVSSVDGMTADVVPVSYTNLVTLNNELRRNNLAAAVLLDLTSKPPGTIEWE